MGESKETISFIASLASTGNTFSSDGNGAAKVVFSVPENELANAVKVLLLRNRTFTVSIEPHGHTEKESLEKFV